MKKILKWTGITLLILIVLLISLPFIFKGKIESKIKEEANKNLNAKVDWGTFDLSLISTFPDFRFTLNQLKIVGIDSFATDTLIAVKELSLDLNLMSVIKGSEYKINSIILKEPHITAKVLKSGKANWDITKPSADITKEAPSESSPFKMTLQKFEITKGDIIYDDATLAVYTALKGMDFTLKGDFTQDSFGTKINSTIQQFTCAYEGVNYLSKVNTVIDADILTEMPANKPDFMKFTFNKNSFKLNELVLGLDGYFAFPNATDMDMDLKIKQTKTEFKHILSLVPAAYTKDFADVKTSGKVAIDAAVKGIMNDKLMPAFHASLLVENAMFQYPSVPKPVNDINIDLVADNKTGNPDNTIVDLKKFHMSLAGNPIDAAFHVETPVSDAQIKGHITGKINLASLRDVMPLDKEDNLNGNIAADIHMNGRMSSIEKERYDEFQANGQFTISDMLYTTKDMPPTQINALTLNFTSKNVDLTKFDGKIGKSDIQADGKLDNVLMYVFKDDMLKGSFNLHSNLMDLNELMGSSADTAQAAADTAAMTIIEVPKNLDFVMTASIGKLDYENYGITNMNGKIVIKDQVIDMTNLKMNLMDGSLNVNGSYGTQNPKQPKVNFHLDVSDFDVAKTYKSFNTIKKMAPIAEYAAGKFSAKMDLKTDLDTKMEPVTKTLGGGGNLKTKGVVVENYPPMVKLADAIKQDKYKKMRMEDANISFEFKDGRVFVKPFDLKMGNSNVKIEGSNGFDQTLDYKMAFDSPRSEFGAGANNFIDGLTAQANAKGANVKLGDRVKFDAFVTGTVKDPKIKTGLKDAAGDAVADLKKQAIDKAKEEADKIKKEAEEKARAEAEKLKKEAEEKANAEAEKLKKEAEEKAKKEAKKLEEQGKEKLKGLFKK